MAVRAVLTDVVVTVNVALVDPLATVTLLGTLALELLLLRLTTVPPEGAAELRVTVPVELLPPVTVDGFRVSDEIVVDAGGLIVSEACRMVLPNVPVIVAVVVVLTDVVVTVKFALVDPLATVTLLGTLALELLLLKLTTVPPEGAAELSVTVPVELLPPVTLAGFKLTEERVGPEDPPGFTVKLVDTVAPPDCPKIGAVQLVVVLVLPTVKLTLVCPAGTVTGLGIGRVTGRVQGGFCERDIRTSLPPDGAGEAMVTVPVELFPPFTLDGFMLIDLTATPGVWVRGV